MPVDPNDSFIGGYAPYVRLQQEIENGKLHNQMLQQALQLAPQELQMRQQQLSQQKQMGDAQIAQIYGMLPAHQAMAMSSVNEANAKIADLKQTIEMSRQLQAGLLDSQKYKNQQEKALADTATQTADLRLKLGEEELKRSGISGNTEATRNLLLNQQIPTIIAQSKADLNKTLATTDELHTQTKSLQQQVELSGVQKEMALMQEMRQWPAEMRKQVINAHADETTPLFNILKDKPELLEDDKFLPYTQMIEGKMMKDPTIGPQLMAAEFEKKFGVPLPNQPQYVTPAMDNPGANFRKALNDATAKMYKDFPLPKAGPKPPVQDNTMPQQQAQPIPNASGSVQQGASNDVDLGDYKNSMQYVDQQNLPGTIASTYSSPSVKKAISDQPKFGYLDEPKGALVKLGEDVPGKGFFGAAHAQSGKLSDDAYSIMSEDYQKNLRGTLDPTATPQQVLRYRAVLDNLAHSVADKGDYESGVGSVSGSPKKIGEYNKKAPTGEQLKNTVDLKGLSDVQKKSFANILAQLGLLKSK